MDTPTLNLLELVGDLIICSLKQNEIANAGGGLFLI